MNQSVFGGLLVAFVVITLVLLPSSGAIEEPQVFQPQPAAQQPLPTPVTQPVPTQPPIIGPQPQPALPIKVPPPQPKKVFCDNTVTTDITNHILQKTVMQTFTGIYPLDDPYNQRFVVTGTITGNNDVWFLYNVGKDGKMSSDDTAMFGGNIGPAGIFIRHFFRGMIVQDSINNEYLYWLHRPTKNTREIRRCSLPGCTGQQVMLTVNAQGGNGHLITDFLPYLVNASDERIYLALESMMDSNITLTSCSLQATRKDSCKQPLTQFPVHGNNIVAYPLKILPKHGFVYEQTHPKGNFYFSAATQQLIPLPGTIMQPTTMSVINTNVGFATFTDRRRSPTVTVGLMNLALGKKIGDVAVLQRNQPTTIVPRTTFFTPNRDLFSLFRQEHKNNWKETMKVGTKESKAFYVNDSKSKFDHVLYLPSGELIGNRWRIGQQYQEMVSFHCTK